MTASTEPSNSSHLAAPLEDAIIGAPHHRMLAGHEGLSNGLRRDALSAVAPRYAPGRAAASLHGRGRLRSARPALIGVSLGVALFIVVRYLLVLA